MRWLGLGGQTEKNLLWLAFKFDLEQSDRKSSQVNASARKAWPNAVASRPKFSTCAYLRLHMARALTCSASKKSTAGVFPAFFWVIEPKRKYWEEISLIINWPRLIQRLDNAIHRINHYPADSVVCFVNTYPLDSDSIRWIALSSLWSNRGQIFNSVSFRTHQKWVVFRIGTSKGRKKTLKWCPQNRILGISVRCMYFSKFMYLQCASFYTRLTSSQ